MEHKIPSELAYISTLYAVPIDKFTSGIYFLYLRDKLIYIGQGLNVFVRICEHGKSKNQKEFDRCFFMACEPSNLTLYEHSLIKYFRPPANKEIARMSLKTANDVICKILGLAPKNYNTQIDEGDSELISSVEAATLLGVTSKVLKRLTDFEDIRCYRKELDPSKCKMKFGKVMYKRKEIEMAKIIFSSLHIPLQNEV